MSAVRSRFLFAHNAVSANRYRPVLDDADTLRRHYPREDFAVVLAYAHHRLHTTQGLPGDGLEIHLLEGAGALGMKEAAMRAHHQRDAMQQTQPAQIVDKKIDGMDVNHVITADSA